MSWAEIKTIFNVYFQIFWITSLNSQSGNPFQNTIENYSAVNTNVGDEEGNTKRNWNEGKRRGKTKQEKIIKREIKRKID